eukprot:CAMPEP_0195137694 /NCGR_PEP_ID=MMETSP0448-20130528/156424_1 /TAXON_ID=66468 /ORGANISM="Heterocapsa triquestra, Strain CCMP 448" /LENGTH=83 /DNA_ID=CAMNT_0040175935 /DNA_START=10 /DNA_END=257 /DNA_ORIENTATION=-
MGKVWLFSSDTRHPELITGFSEEGVRGLYMDQDAAYSTFCEGSRSWHRARPHAALGNVNFRSRTGNNIKHVLQRGKWACVLFP